VKATFSARRRSHRPMANILLVLLSNERLT
jgi:hypothetical protein